MRELARDAQILRRDLRRLTEQGRGLPALRELVAVQQRGFEQELGFAQRLLLSFGALAQQLRQARVILGIAVRAFEALDQRRMSRCAPQAVFQHAQQTGRIPAQLVHGGGRKRMRRRFLGLVAGEQALEQLRALFRVIAPAEAREQARDDLTVARDPGHGLAVDLDLVLERPRGSQLVAESQRSDAHRRPVAPRLRPG